MTKKELFEQIVGLLGGRVAEEIIFDSQSSGASNDFQQATQIARSMVTQYGMSDLLGPVQYEGDGGQVFLGRDYSQSKAYSEQFAYQIDQEVLRTLNEALAEARRILEEHKDAHALIAKKLLEVETLDEKQIKSLFEKGEMPTKEVSAPSEFPSEKEDTEEETEEEIGKTFEEIKATREKKSANAKDTLQKTMMMNH